jgi:hypothetical protein
VAIDDYFAGLEDEHVRRNYVFTNRAEEQRTLLARIEEVVTGEYDVTTLTNYRRPARNLSVVFGQGGIGKTALLRETGRAFVGDHHSARAVAYIDLNDFSNHNFEIILIKLRSAYAQLISDWPAFDLAFAGYWSRKHPGTDLLHFISHTGFLREDERQVLIDQFTAILDSVLGGSGFISAGYKLTALLTRRIREQKNTRQLRERYQPFALLVDESEPDKALGYLPSLLAYDIKRASDKKLTQLLCLLDTLEYVQLARQDKGSLEDLVSRLVYLMPNVAFLAASRLPLKWSESTKSATLTYGGPERWPDLSLSATGQHQIVGLDPASSDELLRDSLEIDGTSAMPAAVRESIISGSQGLPLYLELSVNWYRELILKGETPSSSQVAQSFPELVFRIMRDLSSAERDLLRASAILEAFSQGILKVVAPTVRGADIERFLDRSFVRQVRSSWLPYSLHDNLRRAIIEHDHLTDDAWTPEEWHARARAAVSWIERQALAIWKRDASEATTAEEEGRRAVAAVLLATVAATEHGISPDRLGELAFTTSRYGYRRIFQSMPAHGARDGKLQRLIAVAHVLGRTELRPSEAYEAIRPYVTLDPSNSYDQFIAAEFAEIAEIIGHYREAERAYASLSRASPEIAYYGRLGLAGNALRDSRLASALAAAPKDATHAFHRAAVNDLLGHIHLHGGEHMKAANFFEAAHQNAVAAGSPVWIARSLRHQALARMWFDPDGALDVIPQAREINDALGDRVGLAQCDVSSGLAWAWKNDLQRARHFLAIVTHHDLDMQAIGQPWMIEVLIAKATGNDAAAGAAAERAFETTRTDASRPAVWLAISALWAGREDLAAFDAIEWYDSVQLARERWLDPLARMRRLFASSSE